MKQFQLWCGVFGSLWLGVVYAGLPEIDDANNQLAVHYMSQQMDYAETDNAGVLLDTEKGAVPGSVFSLAQMSDNAKWYVLAQYSRNEGRTDYVGGLIGPPSTPYGSIVSTSGAILTNYSIRLGKGLVSSGPGAGSAHMWTPYLEMGRQEWYRGVNYGETYYHNSVGAGLLWQMSAASSRMVTSVYGLVGQTMNASIDVKGYFNAALGNSPLYKAGMNFDYALNKLFHLRGGVDYLRFNYGKSSNYPDPYNLGQDVYEPESKSTYLQYSVGVGIGF